MVSACRTGDWILLMYDDKGENSMEKVHIVIHFAHICHFSDKKNSISLIHTALSLYFGRDLLYHISHLDYGLLS